MLSYLIYAMLYATLSYLSYMLRYLTLSMLCYLILSMLYATLSYLIYAMLSSSLKPEPSLAMLCYSSARSASLRYALRCAPLLVIRVHQTGLEPGSPWAARSLRQPSSWSPTYPLHRALSAFGDVFGALLCLHSRCQTVKII